MDEWKDYGSSLFKAQEVRGILFLWIRGSVESEGCVWGFPSLTKMILSWWSLQSKAGDTPRPMRGIHCHRFFQPKHSHYHLVFIILFFLDEKRWKAPRKKQKEHSGEG